MAINHASFWPTGYAELGDLGLGLATCEWLEFEIGVDEEEKLLVSVFLAVIQDLGLDSTKGLRKVAHAIQKVIHGRVISQVKGELDDAIRQGLAGITAQG